MNNKNSVKVNFNEYAKFVEVGPHELSTKSFNENQIEFFLSSWKISFSMGKFDPLWS